MIPLARVRCVEAVPAPGDTAPRAPEKLEFRAAELPGGAYTISFDAGLVTVTRGGATILIPLSNVRYMQPLHEESQAKAKAVKAVQT